jgi:hypothetical protein
MGEDKGRRIKRKRSIERYRRDWVEKGDFDVFIIVVRRGH